MPKTAVKLTEPRAPRCDPRSPEHDLTRSVLSFWLVDKIDCMGIAAVLARDYQVRLSYNTVAGGYTLVLIRSVGCSDESYMLAYTFMRGLITALVS